MVVVHDMQNKNTGRGRKYETYEMIGRRIDVACIIPPIAAGVPVHGDVHAVH